MDESEIAGRWLHWCRTHPNVIIIESPVPDFILPLGVSGILYDVRVGSKKRSPDDKIYSKDSDLRAKVARGNCILELSYAKTKKRNYYFLIFALRKFSGGMGDEDEDETACQNLWENYFLQPLENAAKIVATQKANGEAAHLSIRKFEGLDQGQIFYCLGSKNVHLLVRNQDDISKYKEPRYEYARTIASTFFTNYSDSSNVSQDQKDSLISFLTSNHYTGVFELLQPQNEHVEDLSYLINGPVLKFICWTEPYGAGNETSNISFCSIPPDQGLDQAGSLGLDTITYEIVEPERVQTFMQNIRGELYYEGKVLYFMDEHDNVFGIIKKKTAWYIILRALREKICYFCSPKNNFSKTEIEIRIKKRLTEIQKWLGFKDSYRIKWTKLGVSFGIWAVEQHKKKAGSNKFQIRAHFPQLWKEFLNSHEDLKKEYEGLEFVLMESS